MMIVSFDTQDESLKIPDSVVDIELPNEQARLDILKIHSSPITKHGEIGEWPLPCILNWWPVETQQMQAIVHK